MSTTPFDANAFSEEIANKHVAAHGGMCTVVLSDGSKVLDCYCGAPLGQIKDNRSIRYTIDDEDIEAYR